MTDDFDSIHGEREHLVYAASTFWVKYIVRTFLSVLLLIIGIALLALGSFATDSLSILAHALFLLSAFLLFLSHHIFFHMLFSEAMKDILVTNERVIYFNDCLFVCDDEHEIPLYKVAAVEVKQHGFIQNILNYGILWFDTGGGTLDLSRSMPNVHKPEEAAEIITQMLHRQGKESSGNT